MNRFKRRIKALDRQNLPPEVFVEISHALHRDRRFIKNCLKLEKRKLLSMSENARKMYLEEKARESNFNWGIFTRIMNEMGARESLESHVADGLQRLRNSPFPVAEGVTVGQAFEHINFLNEGRRAVERMLPAHLREKKA